MSTERRIRCFSCKKLVLPTIDVYEPDIPYSVVPINYEKKRGCVCSECIEQYASSTDFFPTSASSDETSLSNQQRMQLIFGPYSQPFHRNPSITINFPSNDGKSNVTQTKSNNEKESSKQEPTPKIDSAPKKKDEQLSLSEAKDYFKKYSCLDYSLDSYSKLVKSIVFGQDEALKRLVYTLYFNQLANCLEEYSDMLPEHLVKCFGSDNKLPKRKHILLIGGTGVGKTLLATTVAKVFSLPYSISNATPITSAGYIGDKVENVLERLYDSANNNLELAQNGIIILDEFDKKAVSPDNGTRDVTGKAVQQELLKLLEPSEVWIKKGAVKFNTKNLTIIMMGAFVGLEEIVINRLNVKKIGFGNVDTHPSLDNLIPDDLIEYGFIPEIIGRIPIIIKLNDLTRDVLSDIVYSLLNKYNVFFKYKNYDLIVDPMLVNRLVEESMKSKTGARDLDSKVDELLQPALYQVFQSLPNGVCEIQADGSILLLANNKDSGKYTLESLTPNRLYEDIDDDF